MAVVPEVGMVSLLMREKSGSGPTGADGALVASMVTCAVSPLPSTTEPVIGVATSSGGKPGFEKRKVSGRHCPPLGLVIARSNDTVVPAGTGALTGGVKNATGAW